MTRPNRLISEAAERKLLDWEASPSADASGSEAVVEGGLWGGARWTLWALWTLRMLAL